MLGEEGEDEKAAFVTAERMRGTSLLEATELLVRTAEGKIATARRYTLHPATALFVRDRLGDDEAIRRAAYRRLGDHFEAEARTSPWIEADLEAGHHLLEAGEYDRAYEVLGRASDWLRDHGRVREGLQILEPFLAEQIREAMTPQLVGRLLGTVGLAYLELGEVEKPIGFLEQALVILHEIGDRRGEGDSLSNLGLAYANSGDLEKAIGSYEQALVIYREIGDRGGEGGVVSNLGLAYADLEELEKAIEFYEQALVTLRETGDRLGEDNVLGNLGLAYAALGEAEKAIGFYEQQLIIAREIGHRRGEGIALGNLGAVYHSLLGDWDKAIRFYEQQLAIAREMATAGGRARTWATSALPTPASGRMGRQSRCWSRRWRSAGRSRILRSFGSPPTYWPACEGAEGGKGSRSLGANLTDRVRA